MVTNLQIRGRLKYYTKPYGRQWKWRYQVHGNMIEPTLKLPKGMEHAKIIDPLRPETIPKTETPKWIPPRRHPVLEGFFSQPSLRDHPNYKENPIRLFDRTVKFHAEIDQVCLLTKTKAISGLPESILNKSKQFNLNQQDELIKSHIRQALAFNPTKKECPSIKLAHDPKFIIGREYGTPESEQMLILLDNLVRVSNTNIFKKSPNDILSRKMVENVPISTIFERGDDKILVRRNTDLVVFSKNRPSPISEQNEIAETENFKFIDMYPIFPTVDLKDENVYDLNKPHQIGLNNNLDLENHIHTIFHINNDNFSTSKDISRLIMFAFGSAHAQSQILLKNKKLELVNGEVLKNPLVINAVSISNQRFNFVTYQLNTLNLYDNKGIKNIAYYDTDELYLNRPNTEKLPYPTQRNVQRMALRYLHYNQGAFSKLISLLANGSSQ